MALAVNELWRQGFVVNAVTGQPVFVVNPAVSSFKQGFLRDADGRLVVEYV